ncbi:hypothetical protein BC777_1210 [Yoonia maricola]|uniref:Uncharacterized protein n=1 Tax=Yoonia maricola TaxID=420999 RepID=A0A2M8WN60_9RHOB|nr:hypothetical protein BC777_1210 [Yoonia maricola]
MDKTTGLGPRVYGGISIALVAVQRALTVVFHAGIGVVRRLIAYFVKVTEPDAGAIDTEKNRPNDTHV